MIIAIILILRYLVLEILTAFPSHQRLRVSSMLVKYGTDIAGMITVKRLYESYRSVKNPEQLVVVTLLDVWKERSEIGD